MSDKNTIKRAARARRSHRTRSRMTGTPERPRLSVFRSNAQVYAQLIDDASGRTLAQASTREIKDSGKKSDAAAAAGKLIAERSKTAGFELCVFDRGGYRYHGRVKALAEGAREAGLKF